VNPNETTVHSDWWELATQGVDLNFGGGVKVEVSLDDSKTCKVDSVTGIQVQHNGS
jgi:hypothetical protein